MTTYLLPADEAQCSAEALTSRISTTRTRCPEPSVTGGMCATHARLHQQNMESGLGRCWYHYPPCRTDGQTVITGHDPAYQQAWQEHLAIMAGTQ